jgi:hypothetical protein
MHAGRLLLASCLIGLALVASLPLAAQAVDQRLVYRAEQKVFQRFQSNDEKLVDPEDGRVWASDGPIHGLVMRSEGLVLHTPNGDRLLPNQKGRIELGAVGFLRGYLVVEPKSWGPVLVEGRDTGPWILELGGVRLPEGCHFALVGRQGPPLGLESGVVDLTNTTFTGARLLRTVGEEPEAGGWTALYTLTTRSFEGTRTSLRVRTHGPDGSLRLSLEGKVPPFNLKEVAYFDVRSRTLMLISGEAWGVAEGRMVGAIKGALNPCFVEACGAFYTAEAGTRTRPWGLTDAGTGAIVVGGETARELIVQRLELDAHWNAKKMEVARVWMPVEGSYDAKENARLHKTRLRLAGQMVNETVERAPHLHFGTWDTQKRWVPPSSPEEAMRQQMAGTVNSTSVQIFRRSTEWSVMPSPQGLVHLGVSVNVPTLKMPLHLSILADPASPASPIAINYAVTSYSINSSVPTPTLVATFPVAGGDSQIGIRLVGGDMIPHATFVLDRATGQLGPVPKDQPWAKVPEAQAPAPTAGPRPAESPAAKAERRAAEEKAANELLNRHLDAYNTKNLKVLEALYHHRFEASLQGKSIKHGDLQIPSYDSYKRAAVIKSYAEDFKKSPQSRVKVLTRKVYRDGIGSLWVLETRVAADDSKEPPLFLELRKVDYKFEDGLLVSGRYDHRR